MWDGGQPAPLAGGWMSDYRGDSNVVIILSLNISRIVIIIIIDGQGFI